MIELIFDFLHNILNKNIRGLICPKNNNKKVEKLFSMYLSS